MEFVFDHMALIGFIIVISYSFMQDKDIKRLSERVRKLEEESKSNK